MCTGATSPFLEAFEDLPESESLTASFDLIALDLGSGWTRGLAAVLGEVGFLAVLATSLTFTGIGLETALATGLAAGFLAGAGLAIGFFAAGACFF